MVLPFFCCSLLRLFIEVQHIFVVGSKYQSKVLNVPEASDTNQVRIAYELL